VDAAIAALCHRGRPVAGEIVMLLPCNLDTRWARELIAADAHIMPIHGRLRFAPPVDEDGTPLPVQAHNGAAMPMMIAVLSASARYTRPGPRRLTLIDPTGAFL
jgi:hypothetical protein